MLIILCIKNEPLDLGYYLIFYPIPLKGKESLIFQVPVCKLKLYIYFNIIIHTFTAVYSYNNSGFHLTKYWITELSCYLYRFTK